MAERDLAEADSSDDKGKGFIQLQIHVQATSFTGKQN